jgi:hypothetical protein
MLTWGYSSKLPLLWHSLSSRLERKPCPQLSRYSHRAAAQFTSELLNPHHRCSDIRHPLGRRPLPRADSEYLFASRIEVKFASDLPTRSRRPTRGGGEACARRLLVRRRRSPKMPAIGEKDACAHEARGTCFRDGTGMSAESCLEASGAQRRSQPGTRPATKVERSRACVRGPGRSQCAAARLI